MMNCGNKQKLSKAEKIELKQKIKEEKIQNKLKQIESKSIKEYLFSNFNAIVLLLFLIAQMLFIGLMHLANIDKKLIDYLENNQTQETQAYKKENDITPYVKFGLSSTNTLKNNFTNFNLSGSISATQISSPVVISGQSIWTDGNDIYYSNSVNQYVLDKNTNTWTTKTWQGYNTLTGQNIWTNGNNIYYSSANRQYILDISTSTWSVYTWNGLTALNGINVWTDGIYYYFNSSSNSYILDTSTSTWTIKSWNGLTTFTGQDVWSDGNYIYFSNGTNQYVLDTSTSTWTTKNWNGLTDFTGRYVWSDGSLIYYSYGENQYVLDTSTSTWTTKSWIGLTGFSGLHLWSDGTHIYTYTGSSVPQTFYVFNNQLITPSLQYRYISNSNYLSWNIIPNSTTYAVYKDNVLITDSSTTFYSDGTYINYPINSTGSYYVVAIGDNINYLDSNNSNIVTLPISQLTTPIISLNNNIISWSAVANADNYAIYKDNTLIDVVSTTSYTITSEGTYQVSAYTNNLIAFDNSNKSNSISYTFPNLSTPILSYILDNEYGALLSWTYTNLSNLSFELYKDNVLLTTISNTYMYMVTLNGVYKVKQISTSPYYYDSDFSNILTIDLIHISYILGNNISCSTYISSVDTIPYSDFYIDNSIDFLPYSTFTINNNNANTGYVFNSVADFSTDSNVTYRGGFINNEQLIIDFTEIVGDVSATISSHSATKIGGVTFINYNQSFNTLLNVDDYLIKDRSFTSNELDFNSIYVNKYNYIVYDDETVTDETNSDLVYVFSNLTGQYISNSTYNYNLVTFDVVLDYTVLIQNYLNDDSVFFSFYRVATQSDLDNITFLNNELVHLTENYTFLNLFGAIMDTQINTIKALLNFEVFGINFWAFFSFFFTLTLIFLLLKFIRGGK